MNLLIAYKSHRIDILFSEDIITYTFKDKKKKVIVFELVDYGTARTRIPTTKNYALEIPTRSIRKDQPASRVFQEKRCNGLGLPQEEPPS